MIPLFPLDEIEAFGSETCGLCGRERRTHVNGCPPDERTRAMAELFVALWLCEPVFDETKPAPGFDWYCADRGPDCGPCWRPSAFASHRRGHVADLPQLPEVAAMSIAHRRRARRYVADIFPVLTKIKPEGLRAHLVEERAHIFELRETLQKAREHLVAGRLSASSRQALVREICAVLGIPCSHEAVTPGPNVPRRYGSWRSEVCTTCGAYRTFGHDEARSHESDWRPGPMPEPQEVDEG